MRSFAIISLIVAAPLAACAQDADLPGKARKVLETNCYRCHGKDGSNKGRFGYVLDIKKMMETKKVVAKKADQSEIFARMTDADDPMPPKEIKQRPSKDDIDIVRKWIAAGAAEMPEPTDLPEEKRVPVTLMDSYQAMYKYLMVAERTGSARHQRFFSLTHLHNNPKVTDAQMRHHRAGLAKLLNSLSWRKAIVYPAPIDPAGTILALDLRDLDWDMNQNWGKIIGFDRAVGKVKDLHVGPHAGYPYGLTHDRYPDEPELNTLAKQVYQLTGTEIPCIRADWFLATASLPPLYHELLNLPTQIDYLERQLKVNVAYNFQRDKLARAGFAKSNVSSQNRLVERHDALFGCYWKSYDFKNDDGQANLLQFPLGPVNLFAKNKHPYINQAFVHDGGEMIWSLPNGLHAYLLTDGKGNRIDFGPTEVVRDERETAGKGPAIFNGLSCMACHKYGMVELPKDDVRAGAGIQGGAREKLRRLYPEQKQMTRLVDEDARDYLAAVDYILTPYLRVGPDKTKDIKQFPEVVSSLASPYLKSLMDVETAALELGIKSEGLKASIKANPKLRDGLGLKTWTVSGGMLKRHVWESVREIYSPYQDCAAEMQLGTPVRIRRLYTDY